MIKPMILATMQAATKSTMEVMLRITASLVVLACATLSCSASCSAQEANAGDNAAIQIRALEHAWTVGEARNDNRALDLIFDNALVYVEYGKVMTKGDYLSRIRTASPNLQQIVMEGITVKTFGSTAIVVGTYREKDATDGKPVLTRWRFIDTWVNKKGIWLLVAAASAPLAK